MTQPKNETGKMTKEHFKMILEMGPLLVFFVTNYFFGIFEGTMALVISTVISVIVSYHLTKKLPIMPLIGCVFVTLFGSLTLIFHDEIFIKIKPTAVNLFFAIVLFVAYYLKKNFLKQILGAMLPLKNEGWRILTLRWAVFFLILAVLNEVVWRNFDTNFWVNFKVFGTIPLTLIFSAFQMPVILKYQDSDTQTQV